MILAALPPLWAVLIRLMSPATDATSVPVMMMGQHMQVSIRRPLEPGDAARASTIVADAHRVLLQYADVGVAMRDGYRRFAPAPVGSDEHYVNLRASRAESKGIDPLHPGSLLYRHEADGSRTIVGVMYSAPATSDAAALDRRAPLSFARWHRHVDFCVGPRGTPATDPRFGFSGSIHASNVCAAAGGYFIPVGFGWMTHVYPLESSRDSIWGGMDMTPAAIVPSKKQRAGI